MCCLRHDPEPARSARAAQLMALPPDWDRLLRWAQRHRVTPLLQRWLRAAAPGIVPAPVLARLESRCHAIARLNLLLSAELLRLLDDLADQGIPALPYKGPALAGSLYDNLSLRQFDDLDVLVPERDCRRALDLLLAHGYRELTPAGERQTTPVTAKRYENNFKLIHPEMEIKLELHWRLSFFYPLSVERLFDHPGTVTLAGRTVPHSRPEDLLLILCVHGCKHFWERLQWICDIARFLRIHRDLDWSRLLANAGNAGGRRMVDLGLKVAHDVLRQELPAAIRDQVMGDRVAAKLAAEVSARLFDSLKPLEANFGREIFYLGMRERLRDKVRYSIHLMRNRWTPTAKDRALLPVPAPLSFLHYLVRPFRLVAQYGGTVLGRLFGNRDG